jgi:uncharacterized alpha-E superfamily protein
MLSRVAQRLYWFGRYMERVENTARLINVNSNLLFDLPTGTRISWQSLVDITGSNENFLENHSKYDEKSVMHHLMADPTNPSSIVSCLNGARENVRTTREILPSEVWECINDLYMSVKEGINEGLARKNRFRILQEVIATSQQLAGVLSSIMSNNHGYDFIRIARNLERADMSTRIIDMGCANLLPNILDEQETADALTLHQSILWMHILISLSAYQMYRQHIQNRVSGPEVVRYILKDDEFPRAFMHCLSEIETCLLKLPHGERAAKLIQGVKLRTQNADIDKLIDKGLHEFIDQLQVDLASLHTQIEENWFLVQL